MDICNKCHRPIENDFNKHTEEKNKKLYEFHSDCFNVEEFYKD